MRLPSILAVRRVGGRLAIGSAGRGVLAAVLAFGAAGCLAFPEWEDDSEESVGAEGPAPPKADQGEAGEVAWANQFFVTQIRDETWNPDGPATDPGSNNCGPASLSMLMAERGMEVADLTAEQAIDHARAMMYPDYPEIDASEFPEEASVYAQSGQVCVDDDTRPVFFDLTEDAPSIPQGIRNGGGRPVFGHSWDDLEALLRDHGAVIAYGHITDAWRRRFDGEYGAADAGAIPHFVLLFAAAAEGGFLVCDPMHRGGAVAMTRGHLGTFFVSPVNVYDTTIRLIAWADDADPDGEEPAGSAPTPD